MYRLMTALVGLIAIGGIACAPSSAPWTFENRVFERTEGPCDGPDAPCALVRAEYPELVDGPSSLTRTTINEAIRQLLLDPGAGSAGPLDLELLAVTFLVDWSKARAEFPDAASTASWYLRRYVRVRHRSPRVLSLGRLEERFGGGAHANELLLLRSVDPASGRSFVLDDLFVEGSRDRVDAIAGERFRDLHGIASDVSLSDAGFWFEGDRFTVTDNFAIEERGLVFYYNAYEIGPYALGPTELVLTRDDLGDLIRADGPLAVP